MHSRLALIELINRFLWHEAEDGHDPTDLRHLHQLLPHRAQVVHRKIDFYAWIRFLDVVFAAMVNAAGAAVSGCTTLAELSSYIDIHIRSWTHLEELAANLVDSFLVTSVNRAETERVKTVKGDSVVGHAMITFQLINLLSELTSSVKLGHPTRLLGCLKLTYPIFYAGGSYNYASEIGELLHNVTHDWPPDSAEILVSSLLVNTTGRPDGFKELDIHGEHENDVIKAHTKGPNMTPNTLGQLSPAMGVIAEITANHYEELGVEHQYTKHFGKPLSTLPPSVQNSSHVTHLCLSKTKSRSTRYQTFWPKVYSSYPDVGVHMNDTWNAINWLQEHARRMTQVNFGERPCGRGLEEQIGRLISKMKIHPMTMKTVINSAYLIRRKGKHFHPHGVYVYGLQPMPSMLRLESIWCLVAARHWEFG